MHLDAEQIVETVRVLGSRIHERFPDSRLNEICRELQRVAGQAGERSVEIGRPMFGVRALSTLLIILIVGAFVAAVQWIRVPRQPLQAAEFIQMLEAGFSGLVLIGATIVFLVTLEIRVKRARTLKAIHELRSLAHLVDMSQLTKDPDRVHHKGRDTASSPRRNMSAFELHRYLDYCTEMLSLTGKIGALYVENFPDSHAVGAVNDLENLTSGLARKIWQKIMVLHAVPPTVPPAPPSPSSIPTQATESARGAVTPSTLPDLPFSNPHLRPRAT